MPNLADLVGPIPLLLAILAAALVLFWTEWLPADVVGLGVLLSLVLTGLLPHDQALAGFGSDAVLLILGLLLMTAALMRTGVVEIAGRFILRHAGEKPDRLIAVVMTATAGLSAFISNTAATAFFLPAVVGVAQRTKVPASRLLMPLAFASILTSSVTLISTSTNIVVSGLMVQQGMEPLGMFELAPVGIPIAVVGLLYMYFIGRKLIPVREHPDDLSEQFGLRAYLTEILVLPGSRLVGKTLGDSGLARDLDLTVLRLMRGEDRYLAPRASTELREGDVLLVEGSSDDLLKVKDQAGIDLRAEAKIADVELQSDDVRLGEALVMPRSPVIGRTLKGVGFRERYGLQVLAVNRSGEVLSRKLSDIPLRLGDVLLVQGHRDSLRALAEDPTFRVLGTVTETRPNLKRAPLAIGIFVLVLAAATFKILPLAIAALLGAFLCFVTRCLTPDEAYREVEWKAIVLIGSMLALGAAMDVTGTASWLAGHIVDLVGGGNPIWVLSGFFALTVGLTQPMSNQAAAVVVFPVAIQTAQQMGLEPRAFAAMIAVAASCSFLTPLEPSCLMVYGPGRYRFADFIKAGALLTVLIYLIAIVLVPLVWPLRAGAGPAG